MTVLELYFLQDAEAGSTAEKVASGQVTGIRNVTDYVASNRRYPG